MSNIIQGERVLSNIDPLPSMSEIKVMVIEEALRRSGENRTKAAELVHVSRQTIHTYVKSQSERYE